MRKILIVATCLAGGSIGLSAMAESNLAPTTSLRQKPDPFYEIRTDLAPTMSLRPRARPEYLTVGNDETAAKPKLLIDADGDSYEALTCGWAKNPCPSNDSFSEIDMFALDMDDNDQMVGSHCVSWPLDPYCEPN